MQDLKKSLAFFLVSVIIFLHQKEKNAMNTQQQAPRQVDVATVRNICHYFTISCTPYMGLDLAEINAVGSKIINNAKLPSPEDILFSYIEKDVIAAHYIRLDATKQ